MTCDAPGCAGGAMVVRRGTSATLGATLGDAITPSATKAAIGPTVFIASPKISERQYRTAVLHHSHDDSHVGMNSQRSCEVKPRALFRPRLVPGVTRSSHPRRQPLRQMIERQPHRAHRALILAHRAPELFQTLAAPPHTSGFGFWFFVLAATAFRHPTVQ
jgi:hypothetical protein